MYLLWLALYVHIYYSDGLSNAQQNFYKNTTFAESLFLYLFLFSTFIFICVLTAFFLSRNQVYIFFLPFKAYVHTEAVLHVSESSCLVLVLGSKMWKQKPIHPDCALFWCVFSFHSFSYECEYTCHIFYCKVPEDMLQRVLPITIQTYWRQLPLAIHIIMYLVCSLFIPSYLLMVLLILYFWPTLHAWFLAKNMCYSCLNREHVTFFIFIWMGTFFC